MRMPNWTDPQFVDAGGPGGLNAAFGAVSGTMARLGSEMLIQPGLVQPELMQVTQTGYSLAVTIPYAMGVVTSGGAVVTAHGTVTNQDTQSYSVNFAPLVPASGSIVAYLAATVTRIQQNPVPIPGPPPGHPSYNPNFTPTVGYAIAIDTLALSATLTPPDNLATAFELGRCTLTAGATGVAGFTTAEQVRASTSFARPDFAVSGSYAVTAAQVARYVIAPTAAGLVTTLPPAAQCAGLVAYLISGQTNWTIAASGTEQIYVPRSGFAGASSVAVPQLGALLLWCNGLSWYCIGMSPAMYTSLIPAAQLLGGSGSDFTVIGLDPTLQLAGGTLSVPLLPPPTAPLLGFNGSAFTGVTPPTAPLLGFNGSAFVGVTAGNGILIAGNVISAPGLKQSTTTLTQSGGSTTLVNNGGYGLVQDINFTFPASSPTGGFKLHVFAKINWTTAVQASKTNFGLLQISVFDNTYAYETLVTVAQLIVAGVISATAEIAVSDFAGGYYSPGATINLSQRGSFVTAADTITGNLTAIGTVRLTAIPA